VLHHLKWLAPDPRNTILFTGFQAAGTRGEAMVAGAASVKIHGQEVPIRAAVRNLEVLSAHADAEEILAWLRNFETPPKTSFVTHGEPIAADALRRRIQNELGWNAYVPLLGESVTLR
jgi:metallo-beta-lactamase family protein